MWGAGGILSGYYSQFLSCCYQLTRGDITITQIIPGLEEVEMEERDEQIYNMIDGNLKDK